MTGGAGARRHKSMNWSARVVDTSVFTIVWLGVMAFSGITPDSGRTMTQDVILAAAAVISTEALLSSRGFYSVRPRLPRTDEISRLFTSVLVGGAALAVVGAFTDWSVGAREILVGTTRSFVLALVVRGRLRNLRNSLTGWARPERVIIAGSGEEAAELAQLVMDHPESGLELVGLVGNLGVAEAHGLSSLWLGPPDRITALMHVHQATSAIVCATGFRAEQFRNITTALFQSGYDVQLSTGVTRLWDGRLDVRNLAHEPLVVLEGQQPSKVALLCKRGIDIVGAALLLTVTAPIMLLTALAIKVEDGGPVFFRQPRAGQHGRSFGMIKFRSMVTNAEELKADLVAQNERTGPLFKVTDDPRVTFVGRFIRETSIDELPQAVNVLLGDMSLVGPRPALPEEEAAFDSELRDRFKVRPGITGLWQVEARSNASFNAYRRLDLHYVENRTLGLDLRILMATAEYVLVTLASLPFRPFMRSKTDGVTASSDATVIDLRSMATARLASEESAKAKAPRTSTPAP